MDGAFVWVSKNAKLRHGMWERVAMKLGKWRVFGSVAAGLFACWGSAAWATPCNLTQADFTAMKLSRSKIANQAQADAESVNSQKLLCDTRRVWDSFEFGNATLNGDALNEISVHFLSPEEKRQYDTMMDAFLQNAMGKMTPEQLRKLDEDVRRGAAQP